MSSSKTTNCFFQQVIFLLGSFWEKEKWKWILKMIEQYQQDIPHE